MGQFSRAPPLMGRKQWSVPKNCFTGIAIGLRQSAQKGGLPELRVSAVVHAERQGSFVADLNAFVNRPGIARPFIRVGAGDTADDEDFAGDVGPRRECPFAGVERAANEMPVAGS